MMDLIFDLSDAIKSDISKVRDPFLISHQAQSFSCVSGKARAKCSPFAFLESVYRITKEARRMEMQDAISFFM
jgi:hypothetical protein